MKFSRALKNNKINIIGEIKEKSPSKGVLIKNFNSVKLAKIYQENKIDCISVLIDEEFGGNDYCPLKVSRNVDLPILCKSLHINSKFSIRKAKYVSNADCVLLIMSKLTTREVADLYSYAKSIGLEVLAEIHDLYDLEKALSIDTPLIGINNRNLETLEIDFNITKDLIGYIPKDKIIISESGVESKEDFELLKSYGVRNFLIGHYFLQSKNIDKNIKNLIK